ncbi:MAG: adenylate/guanylate cyclase domain-containing protein, partial [Candidatus Electryoneaceae bacterium]|nr:adenylate/guanylate cyclase domain-containing protein [Candidatus Electryoneaceae bacterium]
MKTSEKAISFVPRPMIPLIEEGRLEERFLSVVAFADVSGFTKMSEQLSKIGHEGAELLTSILNSYFTDMIERIERVGGFVGKFGGDAMTIFYPAESEEELQEVARRVIANSLELQSRMIQFQDIGTRAGQFSLGMKIGIAAGEVLFRVVGPEEG